MKKNYYYNSLPFFRPTSVICCNHLRYQELILLVHVHSFLYYFVIFVLSVNPLHLLKILDQFTAISSRKRYLFVVEVPLCHGGVWFIYCLYYRHGLFWVQSFVTQSECV